MTKQLITTDEGSPPLGAYSQGFRVGDLIYVSGTGPIGADEQVHGDTIEEQTDLAIDNIEAVLRAGGATLADCIKATVHLLDTSEFPRFNEVYARRFPEPRPVRTTVGSNLGQVPGMRVEIDVIAYIGAS
jgi:2-iminobutanoate/2-iminopropanoate deaminase